MPVKALNAYTDEEKALVADSVQNADTSTSSMQFVIDEDDLSSNLATKVPTQRSVKNYVDASIPNNPAVVANTAKVSFPEAPIDGKQYVRKDGAWEIVDGVSIYYAENLAESNCETSYATKVSLNLPPDFEAGDYFIEVNYGWRLYDTTSYDFISRVTLDAVELGVRRHRQEPQDSGSDQGFPAFRRFKRTLTAGSHTINLDYMSSSSEGTPYVWDASITVMKVNIQ